MARYTVTALDTTGIQPYIFGSNRLQENIGASELVKLATEQWPLERDILPKPNNVVDARKKELDDRLRIESEGSKLAAEVIYAGGGNTVIIFRSNDEAIAFTKRLTRKVLKEAPGLSLVVVHQEFDWDRELLSEVVVHRLLGDKLNKSKASRLPSMPLLGLGVTAACESTGLVAARTNEGKHRERNLKLSEDENTRLISLEIAEKLVARDWANKRLRTLFDDDLRGYFDFPSDMDKLGRMKGEESYVAVVHADGNRMGDHAQKIADNYPDPKDNRAYIIAMRNFSQCVDKASRKALKQVVVLLAQSLTPDEDKKSRRWKVAGKIPLERNFLPFRPLVFGGDDLTFVCNAQIGVSLAVAYLEAFERETKKLNLEMHACAGIAMVKMHYPFARAYKLSEKLAQSAKNLVRERYKGQKDTSALDWHFATSGLSGSLKDIRKREYVLSNNRTLLMRPLLLRPEDNDQDGRAWSGRIETLITIFQDHDLWSKKRNKVKALREALREGPGEVKAFIRNYELGKLPEIIPGLDSYQSDGYAGARCGYFDAIELYDHYLRLKPAEEV